MFPKALNLMSLVKIRMGLIFMVISLMLLSCKNGTGPTICTTEFLVISLEVQNTEGEAVDGVNITLKNSESGKEITICESSGCNDGFEGRYQIFNDGLKDETDKSGETFTVSGQKDELFFSENFVFAHDGCHVLKKSGPDTVTIE